MNAVINGVGMYIPKKVVTNKDLASVMDTSDEWITERTGIKERHWFNPGSESTSTMAVEAAKMALANSTISKNDIDLILCATLSPDYTFPGIGVLVQRDLGLGPVPALDIRMQCSGFIYGLSIAHQYIQTGMAKNVLVVGSEVQSNTFNLSNQGRDMAVIFGDGAGAVIVSASDKEKTGILSTHLYSDGNFAEELFLEEPGAKRAKRIDLDYLQEIKDQPKGIWPYMNGRNVFKHAVIRMSEVVTEALNKSGYTTDDLDLLIPHQANLRISQSVQKQLELNDNQVFNNIHKYGNTTAASIPIALCEAINEGKIKKGELLCLVAFGSGFTWASALIRL